MMRFQSTPATVSKSFLPFRAVKPSCKMHWKWIESALFNVCESAQYKGGALPEGLSRSGQKDLRTKYQEEPVHSTPHHVTDPLSLSTSCIFFFHTKAFSPLPPELKFLQKAHLNGENMISVLYARENSLQCCRLSLLLFSLPFLCLGSNLAPLLWQCLKSKGRILPPLNLFTWDTEDTSLPPGGDCFHKMQGISHVAGNRNPSREST